MNSTNGEICPLCEQVFNREETMVIREKGAEGINHASIERGAKICVEAGTHVHKMCQVNYINKKDIELQE